MITEWVLIAQVMASSAMAAIAWFVQEVHYPLFARVPHGCDRPPAPGEETESAARDYHAENLRRTRPIVLVPMAVEATTAAWLAVFPPEAVGRAPALLGLALVAAVILSTGFVQVPLHEALRSGGALPDTIDRLVRTTRLRTAIWTARAGLAAWMLHAAA
jgi:hypothetical protein